MRPPYAGVRAMESKGHYPSGPFRGYKSDIWEGGHRVPFMVRWPQKSTPGKPQKNDTEVKLFK